MTAPAATAATTASATRLAAIGIERAIGGLGCRRFNRCCEQLCFLRRIAQRRRNGALVGGRAGLRLRTLALRLLLRVGFTICSRRLGLCLLRLPRLPLVVALTGVPGLLLGT